MQPMLKGQIDELLSRSNAGDNVWWNQLASDGIPLIEPLPDSEEMRVTFLWRDPEGGDKSSKTVQVFIDINGVTDHHSLTPEGLTRLNNTDVWYATFLLGSDWRGSYSFIPVTQQQLPAKPIQTAQEQREWWCSLFPLSIADPLNALRPHRNSRGMALSAVHLPKALDQSVWQSVDRGEFHEDAFLYNSPRVHTLTWRSDRLGRSRTVWLWLPEQIPDSPLPLVILLDGRNWARNMPIFPVLEAETTAGKLPTAAWLLVDAIDDAIRSEELPCHADFWLALQDELLPQLSAYAEVTNDPSQTVVAGQSYGGLSALYAGLFWPERFGCVLTQSGSFWWPNLRLISDFAQREKHEPGWLVQQVPLRRTPTPLRIFQEAGKREADIHFVNQQMYQALCNAGHEVNYRVYHGGHDGLCWRGGVIDGVRWLLASVRNTTPSL